MAVQNFFKAEDIKACMKKVKTVNLHEVYQVDDELQIKAYYAGHVLGAAMFEVRVGQQSIVYTVTNHLKTLSLNNHINTKSISAHFYFLKRVI